MCEQFAPESSEEIRKMIMQSPCKSCDSDPIPTSLHKQTLGTSPDLITAIIKKNISKDTYRCTGETVVEKSIWKPLPRMTGLSWENLLSDLWLLSYLTTSKTTT